MRANTIPAPWAQRICDRDWTWVFLRFGVCGASVCLTSIKALSVVPRFSTARRTSSSHASVGIPYGRNFPTYQVFAGEQPTVLAGHLAVQQQLATDNSNRWTNDLQGSIIRRPVNREILQIERKDLSQHRLARRGYTRAASARSGACSPMDRRSEPANVLINTHSLGSPSENCSANEHLQQRLNSVRAPTE